MPPRRSLQRTLYSGALLGPLEIDIMTIVWQSQDSTIQDIQGGLPQPAAYTTVMTTLRRLAKKGLLQTRKPRNYTVIYSPRCSREEWERQAAREAVERFLATPSVPRKVLIAAFQEVAAKTPIL